MDKISKEERNLAELVVMQLHDALDTLKMAYDNADELVMTYGWDIEIDELSKSAMLIGNTSLLVTHLLAWLKQPPKRTAGGIPRVRRWRKNEQM